ncbi:MAG: universal stress protein [Chloroflexi bacterium]|nr:MAG: universal stress protein [Chloroflexota bacterium]
MFNHILVPLDGSSLAECVLPHVLSIADALDARVTLFHALERPRDTGALNPIDPLKWQLKKREAERYLESLELRLNHAGVPTEKVVEDGIPAECIINYAKGHQVDLIVLSTHGLSGLSSWNVSSVVQKIILRANKSTLLIRAYETSAPFTTKLRYRRLFIGLDCSARAELVIPIAMRLAGYYQANVVLGTVIREPIILSRFPLGEDDLRLVEQITSRNWQEATHYLEQFHSGLAQIGVEIKTNLKIDKNEISALHNMVSEEQADMVLLVAHGHSCIGRWPYGSVAASFISYGTTSLLIMQDLSENDFQATQAEIATTQTQGH